MQSCKRASDVKTGRRADKNAHQSEAAREAFQEVQNAWEVLSDPQERAWYDSHRAQILQSRTWHQAGATTEDSSPGQDPDGELDLSAYRSKAAFSGFSDGRRGFYNVYGELFSELERRERASQQRQGRGTADKASLPAFGGSGADEKDVRAFYSYWANFQTAKDFSWMDVYNPACAPGRRMRRLMEAENEKRRRAGRLAFVADVRALVDWLKSMDKRMLRFQAEAQQRKAERAEAERQRREDEKAARRQAAEAYTDAAWIRESDEAADAAAGSDNEDSGEAIAQTFECVVCDKLYKTERALQNHENSKKHKEQLKRFKRMMADEDKLTLSDLNL